MSIGPASATKSESLLIGRGRLHRDHDLGADVASLLRLDLAEQLGRLTVDFSSHFGVLLGLLREIGGLRKRSGGQPQAGGEQACFVGEVVLGKFLGERFEVLECQTEVVLPL